MWPKTVFIKGVGIPVESWEDMDDLIKRYGDASAPSISHEKPGKKLGKTGTALNTNDRTLLEQFVEGGNRGISNSQVTQALGKRGKGIRSGLDAWSHRIGLVEHNAGSAFEPIFRSDGRGYKLQSHFLKVAKALLEG